MKISTLVRRTTFLAEDHRSSICSLMPCIYCDFNICILFFIHISIHICWTDKLSIDKSPVTDLIKKLFFRKTVHTVHCVFLFIKIIMLHGEWLVNSEHFTVHFCRFAGKKRPAIAGQGRLFRYGVITFRQPVGVAFLS